MDATSPLINKLALTGDALLDSLSSPNFYIELLCIAVAFAMAWLVDGLIIKRMAQHFEKHPPRRIDKEFILKPLSLLAPVLAILYLGIARPLIEEYGGGLWTEAVIQISFAYIVARSVILIMRFRPMSYFIAAVIMAIAVLDVTGFMSSVTASLDAMAFTVSNYKLSMLGLIHGVIILVIVFWIAGMLSRTLESYLRRSSTLSYSVRELVVKFFKLFVYFVAIMVTLSAVGVDLTAFAVFGGALGVGIGLGLQKITANFVSGITLLMERSIKLGDLIEIDNLSGWVRQLNVRYTLLETFDGREVMIPNDELVSARVTNWTFTHTKARVAVNVGVAYGSDVRLVQKLLLDAAREHPKCIKDGEIKCWLREFGESSMNFMLIFWVPDIKDGRYGPQSEVMMAILDKFKEHNIEIPYPHRVVQILQPQES